MADDPLAQRPDESNEDYWQRVLRTPQARATMRVRRADARRMGAR